MVQYGFFHLKIQKQQFVILVEKMASPCYHGSFFTMKTSEEGGSHFRIPAFLRKVHGSSWKGPSSLILPDLHFDLEFPSRYVQIKWYSFKMMSSGDFFGGTKNQWWWNVMELHSWSFNWIFVLKGNVFWWSFPTWDYFTIYKSPFGDIIWWILNVFCFSHHLFLLHPCIQVFSPISKKNSLVVFQN